MNFLALLRALPGLVKLLNKLFDSVRQARAVSREHEKVEATDSLIDDLAAGRVPVNPADVSGRPDSASRPANPPDGGRTSGGS